jgi:FtsP/CotA-like multicopper oxidase with cupredoxin domain
LLIAGLSWGIDQGLAKKADSSTTNKVKKTRLTQGERQAAANRAAAAGLTRETVDAANSATETASTFATMGVASRAATTALTLDATAAAQMLNPGGTPHYFSHPNYANSPLPTINGAVISVGNPLVERAYATDNATNVFVVAPTPLPNGMIQSFQTLNQASAGGSFAPSAGLSFHAYVLRPTGVPNEYQIVFDSGLFTVPALDDPTVSQTATFAVPNIAVQAGDLLGFYGQGIPLDIGSGSDILSYPAPAAPVQDSTITLGSAGFPLFSQARTYSFGASVLDLSGSNAAISGGIRKFVDGLPGLGASNANNLGQYVSVAVPDATTYPGSDYYEVAVVEYEKQMHSDLPPTKLRGYVQLETTVVQGKHYDLGNGYFSVDPPQYLGTTIVAQKDRPVRIKFYNLLPAGAGGNLFIPVDSSVMGAGMAPGAYGQEAIDQTKPMCTDPDDKSGMAAMGLCYSENRATLHLHGGVTPWISDGTPHQWITPAAEGAAYPQGVSVVPVPDMNDPGDGNDGIMTFYYSNQQSARLLFYHDHAWGITRLNVYAGEAAAYLITDPTEQKLVNQGLIPADQIPLVVQDKTFVPSTEQLAVQDETWDVTRWGGMGSLWLPHVYSPAQNPGDSSGVNQFGRWAYGPWFWPPTQNIKYGPIANPYYDPACDPDVQWCEPSLMPGTPFNSMGMEAFMDTPVVNGTPYPTITLDPKAYRFRVLNAANDRFFNLSLYKAVDANGVACDSANTNPAAESTGEACTEVALNPAEVAAALDDPAGVFPTPLAGTEGPSWIQIGTEGGFLPSPVVIPAHITTWVTDPTVFNAGNVDQHSLLLGPAERADVIVDFSQFAGQTLILYNDAPAAFPARDPRYDYYTGNPDLRDTGGAPSTLRGYGPNTRTVMQIKVNAAPVAQAFNLAGLQNAFAHQPDGSGVFESGQNPIIVGQGAYNSAYGTSFQSNGPRAGLVQIYDTSLAFDTLSGAQLTMPMRPKMIQDEMGEAFDPEYGRMSGFLGVETPNAQAGMQNMILYGYESPPVEIIDAIELPEGVALEPISSADDGTQIWKITHNGVDTHPVHFHLYDVQLLNRVGWDGIIRKPDANELGWKDTIRVSPLEDTIVALRPVVPTLPADWEGLPNSIRLLNPAMPEGVYLSNTTAQEAAGLPLFAFNPDGEPVDVINHFVNYGWEYVWHCHILSHEEMDMMHAQAVGVAPAEPTGLTATRTGTGTNTRYELIWTDNSKNETAFVIERRAAGSNDVWTRIATVESSELGVVPFIDTRFGPEFGMRTYTDQIGNTNTSYEYQVFAINVVGDVWDYSDPAFNEIPPGGGFPTLTLDSRGGSTGAVTAPTNLTAVAPAGATPTVNLAWTASPGSISSYIIQRSSGGGAFTTIASVDGVTTSYADTTVAALTTYSYQVIAVSGGANSAPSNVATVTTPDLPLQAPTNLRATTISTTFVILSWTDNANNELGFYVERSTNNGQTWTRVGQTAANSTVYRNTGLTRGATYLYRVQARNAAGVSAYSNTLSVTTR